MLNIDEYNESLYRSIDKRNKKKAIVQNYSGYLAHATQDENHLEHHKYINKIGDRYIYPEDVARKKKRKPIIATQQDIKESANTNRQVKAAAEQQAKDKKDIFEAKTQEEANKAVEDMRNREKSKELLVVKKTTTPKMTKEEREELLKKQRLANKLAAKHSAFDISDEEMSNYLMHGSVNGLKSVETEKPSEETEDQKKKNELMHYGVPRMKHGHRRWQNEDGSLTPAGRVHYGVGEARDKSKHYNYGSEPKSAYTMDLKPLSKPGERNGKEWQDEQDRLKRIDADQFSKELIKAKELPESKEQNDAYWEKYQEGTKEYEKAQKEALAAEKVFFRIDDLYTAALEKYGTDSAITQAARKKYSKALANFEAKYGYTPQEFD